ncbi:LlaJI family restriction endonuclease [Sutcliffiella sp. NC1]|uniref:LlaJI family restriction endonuclease n=1 Tax=Sutcliffiella sp. NC1 TaxID=3004096 RepID=UPI0022DDE8CA|nr:LlaJI family restriction endonuclease [Sutcliffiella sp. NC1]WBL15115.1 LlaJI family restriction endonuclease [Sutcliffiella sp. NC1]
MNEYKIHVENIEYNIEDYPTEFITSLINKGICMISKDKLKFVATGIIIYKNKFYVIFPKAYSLPKEENSLLEHIRVLFEVLLKYRREVDISPEESQLLGGLAGEHKEELVTAYSIIKDFTQNGLLIKSAKVKSELHTGNIDWATTINRKQPIFSGRSVIYNEAISNKKTFNHRNRLYLLHKYCVYKSTEKYGWLLGLTTETIGLDKVEINIETSNTINFLTNELNTTFVEREINVIKMIRDFLSGVEEQESDEKIETLITPYFHNVWEHICSINFENQYSTLKKVLPKLNWDIESNAVVQKQRPDIMVLKANIMYILDAKYYDINTNLPGWKDIVKQLFYAMTINNNIKSDKLSLSNKKLENRLKSIVRIENVFLFPSGESEPFKYVGKVSVENNEDFNDIKSYKINTYLAMKCFLGIKQFNYVKELHGI